MATKSVVDQLTKVLDRLGAVDQEKLLRKSLGEESLESELKPRLSELERIKYLVKTYASAVHDDFLRQMISAFDNIASDVESQSKRSSAEFLAQRQGFLTNLDTHLDEARKWLTYFVTAAVVERGFLEDEGIRQEYQRTVENLRQETSATLVTVKAEAEKAVREAKQLAEEIEARARRTATRVSVEEAQKQFGDATKELDAQVRRWGWRTTWSIVLLILTPIAFMKWDLPKDGTWTQGVYHMLLRLLVLGAVAGISSFSIRVYRAQLHMIEKNRHRVRVANSTESFLNSALEPQQRDLILAKLVEAIVDFGDSGLIKQEKDEIGSSALSADTAGRILAAISGKK